MLGPGERDQAQPPAVIRGYPRLIFGHLVGEFGQLVLTAFQQCQVEGMPGHGIAGEFGEVIAQGAKRGP